MSKGEGIWLDLPTLLNLSVGPPRQLSIFNPATGRVELVGGSGGGGEPLVLGDSDPADFLLTEDGDILMVEDNRG